MAVAVLSEQDRWKQDRADDALFYAEPRFVQHLDGAFRALSLIHISEPTRPY